MTTRTWHDNHFEHTTMESHPNRWRHFIQTDPFNPQNQLEGGIQMQGGEEYGALDIREVNGRPAPQFITVMPKTTYPFFKDGSWVLHDVLDLQAYTKLDGTNICQFGYHDADGREFTSFKVRVRPFMAPHFINLMEPVLRNYPGVREKKLWPGEAIMYELYGHDNPMLIRYPHPIDLALLFARDHTGRIVTLQEDHHIFEGLDCPRAPHRPIGDITDIQAEYRRRQEEITGELVKITDEQFDGQEGEMLYAAFPEGSRSQPGNFTRLIKLKAHQIEEVHWAKDHIDRKELEATARNVFELTGNPTEQDLIQLLAEDWNESQIEKSLETIRRVLADALERRTYQERVMKVYREHHGPEDFQQDPRAVMRSLSQHFSRHDMNKVYSTLVERGLADPKR